MQQVRPVSSRRGTSSDAADTIILAQRMQIVMQQVRRLSCKRCTDCSAHLTEGELNIACARRKVHDQVVQLPPLGGLQQLLRHTYTRPPPPPRHTLYRSLYCLEEIVRPGGPVSRWSVTAAASRVPVQRRHVTPCTSTCTAPHPVPYLVQHHSLKGLPRAPRRGPPAWRLQVLPDHRNNSNDRAK